jgi:hypothetical protein
MYKYLITASFILIAAGIHAQVTVSTGSAREFSFKKQPLVTPLATDDKYYFDFRKYENASLVHTLITANNKGTIDHVSELRIDVGSYNNSHTIVGVYVVGNKLFAAVENPDKSAGLNTLSLRMIENGKVAKDGVKVGAMEFEKLTNQGNWLVAVTPDKNHLAVVGQMPRDKSEPNRYKYFFLDGSLKETSKGELSFGVDDTKRIRFNDFVASDKGDLYLIKNEFDKTYTYPQVYKASVSAPKGTIIDVQPEDAALKVMTYTTAINNEGDLILAGYYKKKSSVVVGDEQAKGSWWYALSKSKMLMNEFEKPVTNMNAEGLLKNGDTWFLVGEQYKATRETSTQQGTQYFEDNYMYKHNDVIVTAFDDAGTKKFEIPLSKNYSARNFDADLYPGFGILNGKLAVVYNDQYGKYFPNSSYSTYKLPVLVFITNDGLMEQPVHFAKELDVTNSGYTLYPQLFNAGKELLLLAGNETSIKSVVFH